MTSSKEPILIISPSELKFKFELRKQIPATLVLQNPAMHTVAFKIKTTTPKKYCVRPSTGFVLPQSKVPVQIMMSSQRETPLDFNNCRDKFLVQSVKLSEEEAGNPISADLFSKVGGKDVHEYKLKVSYVSNAAPSPVKETLEGPATVEVTGAMRGENGGTRKDAGVGDRKKEAAAAGGAATSSPYKGAFGADAAAEGAGAAASPGGKAMRPGAGKSVEVASLPMKKLQPLQ